MEIQPVAIHQPPYVIFLGRPEASNKVVPVDEEVDVLGKEKPKGTKIYLLG